VTGDRPVTGDLQVTGPVGGSLTDVPGLLVGHHHRLGDGWATGTTVVLAPPGGAVAAVDVRGGGPGTRETDLLDPSHQVQRVHAVVLSGGSVYGLAAADGVVGTLAGRGVGLPVGPRPEHVVPIVPAAVLFDLGIGDWGNTPTARFGAAACAAASAGPVPRGCVGAGVGAVAGSISGGVGCASTVLPSGPGGGPAGGITVAALVVANSAGEAVDPRGLPFALDHEVDGEFGLVAPEATEVAAAAEVRAAGRRRRMLNTTIGVIATDAALDKAQLRRLAVGGHDGLARAVRPAHLLRDGDTLFALSAAPASAPRPPDPGDPETITLLDLLSAAAADVVARAIVHAVLAAGPVAGIPAYRQVYPSALRRRA
jgi:L-aminopeptidase/D-esterase-like protein